MKVILFIVFFTCFSANVFSQYTSEDQEELQDGSEDKNPLNKLSFKDRLYTGGNIVFSASGGYILFEASPNIGYRITQKFSAGIGAKYIYLGRPGNSSYPTQKYTVYGGSVFSRYKFTDNLFAHAELELLNAYNYNPNSIHYQDRALAKMFFLGAGYNNRIGGNIAVQIMLLYDVINDVNSPYQFSYVFGPAGPPIIYRIGFTIGI